MWGGDQSWCNVEISVYVGVEISLGVVWRSVFMCGGDQC